MKIKIGSRTSELAMKQTEAVKKKLTEIFTSDIFEIVGISTRGDREQGRELKSFGGKGVFVKEIEYALMNGTIDMAVHSAKDMPADIPEELEIGAALMRADRRDVLVCYEDNENIRVIGTGSVRREAQAKKMFRDAVFKPIRGNINTRLAKLRQGEYDAVIMAKAALDRLCISDVIIKYLGDNFICAAGQGILAVETRKGAMKRYTEAINDAAAMAELTAERAFLKHMGGGCHAPCGASAVYRDGIISMRAFYSDGINESRTEMTGSDPVQLGEALAKAVKGHSAAAGTANGRDKY